ncbi:MAG: hypothetical protein Q9227_009461 [Pyrenula ochraceoflavens]
MSTTTTTNTDSQTTSTTPTTTSTSPNFNPSSSHLDSLQRDGFVIIPNLLTSTEVSTLLQASIDLTSLATSGSWPHLRTVPKQFPPWPSTPPPTGIWGIQHLLHPSIPYRSTFASVYFHPTLLSHITSLLSLPPSSSSSSSSSSTSSSLVMELFNLLISPTSPTHPFSLTWHRDDIPPHLTPSEESTQLHLKSPPDGPAAHAQYNIALTPDSSLLVIPGSHRRIRTDTERSASPYAAELPDQLTVRLNPGDAVFYDSNILHRGVYPAKQVGEVGRYTLHGSVGVVGFGEERARQVLQHAVGEWVEREDAGFKGLGLGEEVEEVAEGMRGRLVEMGRERGGGDVGYSLEG